MFIPYLWKKKSSFWNFWHVLFFFKWAGNSRTGIWMFLFFKLFFLWVSQSFMSLNIRHRKLGDSFLCIFSVLIGQKCCVHTCMDLCKYEHTCMNPDVLFTVFKIVFYEILIMLENKFITKQDIFYNAVINTNQELYTWPLPK